VSTPEYGRYLARKFEGLEVILSPNFDGAYSPVFDTVAENLIAAGTKLPITQHRYAPGSERDSMYPSRT